MWRALITTVIFLLLLMRGQLTVTDFDPEIPAAAQLTIAQDYLEWIHPPKRGGECADMPVVKVTWMEPRGVDGVLPVLWVKDAEKYGAILGLTYSDLRYVEQTVWVQPVIVLRDVSIMRFCEAKKRSILIEDDRAGAQEDDPEDDGVWIP